MPYATISDLPEHIRKYSEVVQRQWLHVWNSTYSKLKKEGAKDAEARAFQSANSVLGKRMGSAKGKESHSDSFNYMINKFLKNV